MNDKDRAIALVDALNEALAGAVDAVDRQVEFGHLYPKEFGRRHLIDHERAELFLRALRRYGYDVVPA